jgi:hypothetical protein
VIAQFDMPASVLEVRLLELVRRRAADEAGWTVWCAAAVPNARSAADLPRREEAEASRFADRRRPCLDAHIVAWRRRGARRRGIRGVAAFMSAPGVISVKEIASNDRRHALRRGRDRSASGRSATCGLFGA